MSRKQYVPLAKMIGDALAIADLAGGEQARAELFGEVYCPLVAMLAADNPRFDRSRFAYAAEQAEQAYLASAADLGRVVS
jgi:hypothetical protein